MPFHGNSWYTLLRVKKNIETLNKGVNGAIVPASILTNSSVVEINNIVQSMQNTAALNVEALNIPHVRALDTYIQHLLHVLDREPDTHEVVEHPEKDLLLPEARERIVPYSPSLHLLEKLRSSQMSLHDLHWRQLEELVAEMLTQDGYHVQLGRGTKDGGVDIIAVKEDPITGFFMAVWQAKKLKAGNKVDIHVIRELADTRQQHNATKGIIVTTTLLTKDALDRIEQDRYILGKVDGNDLSSWIQKEK
jgi:HJR/Mrr/RecB family endonuclease